MLENPYNFYTLKLNCWFPLWLMRKCFILSFFVSDLKKIEYGIIDTLEIWFKNQSLILFIWS